MFIKTTYTTKKECDRAERQNRMCNKCSSKCSGEKKRHKIICFCLQCNSEFLRKPSMATNKLFCSVKCWQLYRIKPKDIKIWKCFVCNETVSKNKKFCTNHYPRKHVILAEDIEAWKLSTKSWTELCHDTRRKRIIIEQNNKCAVCDNSTWLEKPLTLELDHIDGNRNNNIRTNLHMICPNCHSQTLTWRGRNISHRVSDEIFIEALRTTKNTRQALDLIGMSPKGGNYRRAKRLKNFVDPPSNDLGAFPLKEEYSAN